eukprot:scaffold112299_cov50-Attheya_sp.AAC.2
MMPITKFFLYRTTMPKQPRTTIHTLQRFRKFHTSRDKQFPSSPYDIEFIFTFFPSIEANMLLFPIAQRSRLSTKIYVILHKTYLRLHRNHRVY